MQKKRSESRAKKEAQQAIDTISRLFTTYIPYSSNDGRYGLLFAGSTLECQGSTCPLYNLYNNANFQNISKLWQEYRIKKVTVHVMVQSMTNGKSGALWNGFQTLTNVIQADTAINQSIKCQKVIVGHRWARSGLYQMQPPKVALDVLAASPGCKMFMWTPDVDQTEFWTSIIADKADEMNWLSTAVAPNVDQNKKGFFNPILNFDFSCQGFYTNGHCLTCAEEEVLVECRGSKQ